MSNTYWNNKGKYKTLADKLHELIPSMGEVANPKENPALEKYRKAVNCYYDLFNNGLCNRAKEFKQVFGFAGTWIAKRNFPPCTKLEHVMDLIILEAYAEQFLLKGK